MCEDVFLSFAAWRVLWEERTSAQHRYAQTDWADAGDKRAFPIAIAPVSLSARVVGLCVHDCIDERHDHHPN